jgi:hypothetical protein
VISISKRIFYSGGYFILKLDVPLNVSIFLAGLLSSGLRFLGSLISIETFTASKVSTFDWNIKKSEVSTFTGSEGMNNFTQMKFFSEEYSM